MKRSIRLPGTITGPGIKKKGASCTVRITEYISAERNKLVGTEYAIEDGPAGLVDGDYELLVNAERVPIRKFGGWVVTIVAG